jgi:hypothetical protein
MRGQFSSRAFSTPRSRPSKNGLRSVPGSVKFVRGSASTDVSETPVSCRRLRSDGMSWLDVPHISTASKPAAAAALIRSA